MLERGSTLSRENPPASGFIRHDSLVGESESEPAGNRSRFALVEGQHSSHFATAAPGLKRVCSKLDLGSPSKPTTEMLQASQCLSCRSDGALGARVSVAASILDLDPCWCNRQATLLHTKANLAQSQDFRMRESWPTLQLGFFQDTPFFPRRCVPSLSLPHVASPRSQLKTSTFTHRRNCTHDRVCGGVMVRLVTSHLGEPGSIPGGGNPLSFACGNRAGQCRWPANFLGDIQFPQFPHSGAAPYSSRFILNVSQDLDDLEKSGTWTRVIGARRRPAGRHFVTSLSSILGASSPLYIAGGRYLGRCPPYWLVVSHMYSIAYWYALTYIRQISSIRSTTILVGIFGHHVGRRLERHLGKRHDYCLPCWVSYVFDN
ncbi:hypothetical protein PR048_012274 [Dryococelus australis]|uniref:Uncharacterized protein n=1 Tax=Dryococelus australis TaxID=614101 RepID=A0ABQ9HNY3_9NEOP|nr:hypothetical protein PR048_012274 [Dryococelus australis]